MRDRMEPMNSSFFPYMSPEIDNFVRNHQYQLDEYHKKAVSNSVFNLPKIFPGRTNETNEGRNNQRNVERAQRMNNLRAHLRPRNLIRAAYHLFFLFLLMSLVVKNMDPLKGFLLSMIYACLQMYNYFHTIFEFFCNLDFLKKI